MVLMAPMCLAVGSTSSRNGIAATLCGIVRLQPAKPSAGSARRICSFSRPSGSCWVLASATGMAGV